LGWRDSRWGMTEEQILNTFKGEAVRLPAEKKLAKGNYCNIVIENVKLGISIYQVNFVMDGQTKGLITVRISPAEKWNLGDKTTQAEFKDLEKLLIEKYGNPSYRDEMGNPDFSKRIKGHTNLVTKWNFPTTSIQLSYLEDRQTKLRYLNLNYRPNINKDIDKL
jgi:hypothetical protein